MSRILGLVWIALTLCGTDSDAGYILVSASRLCKEIMTTGEGTRRTSGWCRPGIESHSTSGFKIGQVGVLSRTLSQQPGYSFMSAFWTLWLSRSIISTIGWVSKLAAEFQSMSCNDELAERLGRFGPTMRRPARSPM
ncbi:hypothetical protein BC826DRAFT_122577 [Russula brevipes]|nr:hypothetical protein BC826DRAFT_122577 [Russula brevipes]